MSINMIERKLWSYRQPFTGRDLVGFKVEATDGSIGKIDEATYEMGTSYVVVDTGPWIFGKKVLLPAGTIQTLDWDEKKVFVDRTKDEIKNAPEFDPDMYQEPVYREKMTGYYGVFYDK